MPISHGDSYPNKREDRPVAKTERLLFRQPAGVDQGHTENQYRVQFLTRRFAMPAERAALIAALAFGVAA